MASPGDPRHSAAMAEDAESLKLEMLDEDSLTRQPDEVSCFIIHFNMKIIR